MDEMDNVDKIRQKRTKWKIRNKMDKIAEIQNKTNP